MRNIRKVLVLCALFLMSALAAPVPAHADSYPNARIEASVLGNGSLRVVETRAFRFDDDGNGVYWTIPLASNEQGAASSVAIGGVMVDDGETRACLPRYHLPSWGTMGSTPWNRREAHAGSWYTPRMPRMTSSSSRWDTRSPVP